MSSYGQYCPISRTAELLGDRWTIHLVRDLLNGSSRFNELIRGNPGLSRSLLARRLSQLEMAGVVEHDDSGQYLLTASGLDLEPVVDALAAWGASWAFGDPVEDELDPDLLLWWLHRRLDTAGLPAPRFVIHVPFDDHPKRYWIVAEPSASLCVADPGFEVDVTMRTDRRSLYRAYLGRTTLLAAQRRGDIDVSGARAAVRAFFDAFGQSPVAGVVGGAG